MSFSSAVGFDDSGLVAVWSLRQRTIENLGNLILYSMHDCRGILSIVNEDQAVSVAANSLDFAHFKQIEAHVTDRAGLT